jgi:hypothetical protein
VSEGSDRIGDPYAPKRITEATENRSALATKMAVADPEVIFREAIVMVSRTKEIMRATVGGDEPVVVRGIGDTEQQPVVAGDEFLVIGYTPEAEPADSDTR